jgi:predicted dienelactone hydrolase
MIRSLCLVLLIVATPLRAAAPIGDAPALGSRTAQPVGVRAIEMRFANRPDVTHPDGQGGFATATRRLPLLVWYPAAGGDQHTSYDYETSPVPTVAPGTVPAIVHVPGAAARDAAPAAGRFPLLVISHGFLNRAAMFSDLAEILASRGYVVAVIDHGDLDDMKASRDFAFLNVIAHRADDQRLVIAEIARAADGKDAFWSHVDPARTALAGYSMGGYGALQTAGATIDAASPMFAVAPKGSAALLAPVPVPTNLKALITFGPWGGGQPLRIFAGDGLARVKLPSLFIDGDQDDVADYAGGVRWLWAGMGGDRFLLTYQNARHNIATNETPVELRGRFEYRERQDEPVWRKDRILGINAHMITAFLDWQLKGQADARAWLAVPVESANDGKWPVAPGVNVGDATAVPGQAPLDYWPGFQRRWALGLRMEHMGAARP